MLFSAEVSGRNSGVNCVINLLYFLIVRRLLMSEVLKKGIGRQRNYSAKGSNKIDDKFYQMRKLLSIILTMSHLNWKPADNGLKIWDHHFV